MEIEQKSGEKMLPQPTSFDAIVVMRAGDIELGFVMNRDMTREAFEHCCARLRELVLS